MDRQYAEPIFRQMIGNAITWASSKEAHDWAQHRFQESGTSLTCQQYLLLPLIPVRY